jgi:hypothetical protein
MAVLSLMPGARKFAVGGEEINIVAIQLIQKLALPHVSGRIQVVRIEAVGLRRR